MTPSVLITLIICTTIFAIFMVGKYGKGGRK